MILKESENLQKRQLTILNKKGIHTVDDLARFAPRKYIDFRRIRPLQECLDGTPSAFCGTLLQVEKRPLKGTKREYILMRLLQEDGILASCMMFHNLYLFEQYCTMAGKEVVICGKAVFSELYGYSIQNVEEVLAKEAYKPFIKRIYRKIQGISEKKMTDLILEALTETEEPLEPAVLERDNQEDYRNALYKLHFPKNETDIAGGHKRLLYNDMLYFALSLQEEQVACLESDKIFQNFTLVNQFAHDLPFRLTNGQIECIQGMIDNAKCGKRNNVLLQGDVGCGKTVVAAAMMMCAAGNGYQSVLMAPRTVLAKQHYEEISRYAEQMGRTCVFLHAGMRAQEKRTALRQIMAGEADFIVGTHSCFAQDVIYHNLGFIITDEEHLFGVEQKEAIKAKAEAGVHVMCMSATPIPRTLTDVLYGNSREVMCITEKPAGRKEIITKREEKREPVFARMLEEIRNGHKCYVVCPAIEDDEEGILFSTEQAIQEYEAFFAPQGISVININGKMKHKEIEEKVQKFVSGECPVLISTTVIEVGVNVPDATVMVVEQADRFGLASLHQLRGRVGRSELQSYCFLLSEDSYNQRLLAMEKTNDGFRIAEADMQQRGGGDLIGTKQSGFNQYLDNVIHYPNMYRKIQGTAEFCKENGFGKRLLQLYRESEREKEKEKKAGKN